MVLGGVCVHGGNTYGFLMEDAGYSGDTLRALPWPSALQRAQMETVVETTAIYDRDQWGQWQVAALPKVMIDDIYRFRRRKYAHT